ncbi:Aste57867_15010 [Aphanomyces stellatus]|uniref:Aste57867_15010 protein n=1 Tax=Aphanomyces stellatus TaxID=120398 RepID=A0A485L4T7_9STRA|nr:hypothetical protein As57867_014954 [Aphanomyces stellatus]VFT91824.1 Aste57867_15010 [Aphanomyces stellatus]
MRLQHPSSSDESGDNEQLEWRRRPRFMRPNPPIPVNLAVSDGGDDDEDDNDDVVILHVQPPPPPRQRIPDTVQRRAHPRHEDHFDRYAVRRLHGSDSDSSPPAPTPHKRRRRAEEAAAAAAEGRSTEGVVPAGNGVDVGRVQQASIDSAKAKLKCPLCLEVMCDITATKCGHAYCKACITHVIAETQKCPLCRRRLQIRDIHPLFL